MKKFNILLLASVILVSCDNNETKSFKLAVLNTNLIDGTGNPMQENVNLYIDKGKIVTISEMPLEAAEVEVAVDGSGKYVIPGLIESHFHPGDNDIDPKRRKNSNHRLKAMVHYGVTSTLIPGTSRGGYKTFHELQTSAADGSMVAPNIYFTSPFVTVPGGHPAKTYPSGNWVDGQNIYYLEDASRVEPIIEKAKTNKAVGIKLMVEDGPMPPFIERMDPDLIRKVVDGAHNADLPVFAHVSDMEEVRICMEAGVDNLVHFVGVRIDWEKDTGLITEMAENQVSWITTLALVKSLVFYHMNPQWLEKPEIRQVYDSTLIAGLRYPGMEEEGRALMKGFAGTDTLSLPEMIVPMVKDIARIMDAGVNVVLGTDVGGDPYIFAGLSMHEEMEMMQMGGLEPLRIIKMATFNGASMLGIEEEYGSLEKGKYADFILLSENPLTDITNTMTIEKVYKAGVEQPRIKTGRD